MHVEDLVHHVCNSKLVETMNLTMVTVISKSLEDISWRNQWLSAVIIPFSGYTHSIRGKVIGRLNFHDEIGLQVYYVGLSLQEECLHKASKPQQVVARLNAHCRFAIFIPSLQFEFKISNILLGFSMCCNLHCCNSCSVQWLYCVEMWFHGLIVSRHSFIHCVVVCCVVALSVWLALTSLVVRTRRCSARSLARLKRL